MSAIKNKAQFTAVTRWMITDYAEASPAERERILENFDRLARENCGDAYDEAVAAIEAERLQFLGK